MLPWLQANIVAFGAAMASLAAGGRQIGLNSRVIIWGLDIEFFTGFLGIVEKKMETTISGLGFEFRTDCWSHLQAMSMQSEPGECLLQQVAAGRKAAGRDAGGGKQPCWRE